MKLGFFFCFSLSKKCIQMEKFVQDADDDAESLYSVFGDELSAVYGSFIGKKILNAEATKSNILDELNAFWFEEPVSCRDLDALAEVHDAIDLPVVTGEELYTKVEFRPAIDASSSSDKVPLKYRTPR